MVTRHVQLSVEKQQELEQHLFYENMIRSKLFAKIVIVFEAILIARNLMLADQIFNIHFFMYILLFTLSSVMLVIIKRFEKGPTNDKVRSKKYKITLHILVSLFLLWGSVLTLIDQQGYGHVMAFVVNAMCVSVLFYTSKRSFLLLFFIPISVVYIGLPIFQESESVWVGHYINLTVFLFFCWLASKIIYNSHYKIFSDQLIIAQSNEQLQEKIVENAAINLQLKNAVEQLKQLTINDELAQIPNRRGFDDYIKNHIGLTTGEQQLAIIMIDIDGFKLYNDHYGHVAGDQIIRIVAQQIQASINPNISFAARYGGEEFIIATFNMPTTEVVELAESIRKNVEKLKIPHSKSPVSSVVTISLGLASCPISNIDELKEIVERADQMLYVAKQNGRNRLEIAEELIETIS